MGSDDVFVRRGGGDGPALLLLHGLGATGHVWDGLIALLPGHWPGAWIVPDRIAIGIKARWSAEELARAAELADRPARAFTTREEAADRALKFAGLTGLVPPDAPFLDAAVVPRDAGWGLALNPAAFAVGAPAMEGLLAAARGAVVLAAGEHDPMSPVEHLQSLVPDPVVLKGLGHNAHVEDPAALVPLIDQLAAVGSG